MSELGVELPWDRPASPIGLHAWVRDELDLVMPTAALIDGHSAPFDYLKHAYFDGNVPEPGVRGNGLPVIDPRSPDCVVWANRGGGKTFLGAVATLLDLVFKPGIEVRILAGSLDQASRMHAHLLRLFEIEALSQLIDGKPSERGLKLVNGSNVELLTQSQRSVRGTRVQKLRCDEVELFDPEVWEAAQLTTRSKRCGDVWVPGTIECLSTMHVPYGLMYRLVQQAEKGERALFKWGVVDVLGACGDEHACATCDLKSECAGRAKARDASGAEPGHVSVDDALVLKSRVSEGTWAAEMLSLRPRRSDYVLAEFEVGVHVFDGAVPVSPGMQWVGGMDFGIRSPSVVLWGVVDLVGVLRVVGERVVAGEPLGSHVEAIKKGATDDAACVVGVPAWIGIDPAGRQRSDQTGVSNAQVMKRSGLVVKDRRMGVQAGLDLVRKRLKPASGRPTLFVHRRCVRLIESLERYRYSSSRPESLEPVKDGSDHAVDALRYLVQNLDAGWKVRSG